MIYQKIQERKKHSQRFSSYASKRQIGNLRYEEQDQSKNQET